MSKQRKADLALVLVTLFWGVSYYLVDLCLDELQPMNLNAFRFLLAFLVLAPIFWKKLRHINRGLHLRPAGGVHAAAGPSVQPQQAR